MTGISLFDLPFSNLVCFWSVSSSYAFLLCKQQFFVCFCFCCCILVVFFFFFFFFLNREGNRICGNIVVVVFVCIRVLSSFAACVCPVRYSLLISVFLSFCIVAFPYTNVSDIERNFFVPMDLMLIVPHISEEEGLKSLTCNLRSR